jgi:hypothetical protein
MAITTKKYRWDSVGYDPIEVKDLLMAVQKPIYSAHCQDCGYALGIAEPEEVWGFLFESCFGSKETQSAFYQHPPRTLICQDCARKRGILHLFPRFRSIDDNWESSEKF